jgi:hypothetical protein
MKKTPPKQFEFKEQAPHARMIYNSSLLQQLPYILIYPLQGHALPLIIIFSFLLWITLGNALAVVLFFTMIAGTLKYAYSVLEETMLGYAMPPPLTFEIWSPTNLRPVKQLLYLLLIFGIASLIQTYAGNLLALLFLIFGIFFMPASAVIIANQNNLLAALNPLKLSVLIYQIGISYLVISFLFTLNVVLSLPIFLMMPLVGQILPEIGLTINGFFLLLLIMLDMYLLLMVFHLLGFVVYHRRDSLGFEVVFSPEREEEAQQQAQNKQIEILLDEIYWLTRQQGQEQAAVELLLAKLPEFNERLDIQHRLFERTCVWETKQVALVHGQYYLNLLLQKKQFAIALTVYQTCLTLDAQFEPKTPYQILPLAKQACQEKQYPFALSLLEKFLAHYPNHVDNVEAKLLMAQLLAEQSRQVKEAKVIMASLLKEKEHRLYPQIKKYALFLAKVEIKKRNVGAQKGALK